MLRKVIRWSEKVEMAFQRSQTAKVIQPCQDYTKAVSFILSALPRPERSPIRSRLIVSIVSPPSHYGVKRKCGRVVGRLKYLIHSSLPVCTLSSLWFLFTTSLRPLYNLYTSLQAPSTTPSLPPPLVYVGQERAARSRGWKARKTETWKECGGSSGHEGENECEGKTEEVIECEERGKKMEKMEVFEVFQDK